MVSHHCNLQQDELGEGHARLCYCLTYWCEVAFGTLGLSHALRVCIMRSEYITLLSPHMSMQDVFSHPLTFSVCFALTQRQ